MSESVLTVFTLIFERLSHLPTTDNKLLAREVFGWTRGYDLDPSDFDDKTNKALLELGVARIAVGGNGIVYAGDLGFREGSNERERYSKLEKSGLATLELLLRVTWAAERVRQTEQELKHHRIDCERCLAAKHCTDGGNLQHSAAVYRTRMYQALDEVPVELRVEPVDPHERKPL